jgi:hypothetical protein
MIAAGGEPCWVAAAAVPAVAAAPPHVAAAPSHDMAMSSGFSEREEAKLLGLKPRVLDSLGRLLDHLKPVPTAGDAH